MHRTRSDRHTLRLAAMLLLAATAACSRNPAPDPDLTVPSTTSDAPAPGKRVRHQLRGYLETEVHHTLYLPSDWRPGNQYPVIVEYPGNQYGPDGHGDVCTGTPEGCKLGYGLSGGKGVIWLCLPFVDASRKRNQLNWWGDVDATVDYTKRAVRAICRDFGGDPSAVILAGFSRGAIACGYIGLRDDEIASLWRAFVPHSHYDGVRDWGFSDGAGQAARKRLQRLRGRPSFVTQEKTVFATQRYVEKALGKDARGFTFVALPTARHTDTWVLRDTPERRRLRLWFTRVLKNR